MTCPVADGRRWAGLRARERGAGRFAAGLRVAGLRPVDVRVPGRERGGAELAMV
jgi:hypothetical protein